MGAGHTARKVLDYIVANADKPTHYEEVSSETGLEPSSANNALARMLREGEYPNLRRVQRGIYIWDSVPKTRDPGEYLVKVLKTKGDSSMLVQDEDTGRVFVMKEVDW